MSLVIQSVSNSRAWLDAYGVLPKLGRKLDFVSTVSLMLLQRNIYDSGVRRGRIIRASFSCSCSATISCDKSGRLSSSSRAEDRHNSRSLCDVLYSLQKAIAAMARLSVRLLVCCWALFFSEYAASQSLMIPSRREVVDRQIVRKRQSGIDDSEIGKSDLT